MDAAKGDEDANQIVDTIGTYSTVARMTRIRETPGGGREFYTVQNDEAESLLAHIHLATQLRREMSRTFLFPSLNREQEDHADLLGVDLVRDAGYSPAAMITLLDRTASQVQQDEENAEKLSDRERAVAARAAETLGLVDTSNIWQNLGMNIGLEIYGEIRSRARSQYRALEQRADVARNYIRREYIHDMGRALRDDRLQGLKAGSGANLVSAYDAAFDAENLFAAYNDETLGVEDRRARLQEAMARSDQAVALGGGEESYVRFQRFQLFKAAGQPGRAFAELEVATGLDSASAEIFETYARELLDRRRAAEADLAMDRGEYLIGTAMNFLDMRVEADAMAGQVEPAMAHYEECRATENDSLKESCRQIALEYGLISETEATDFFRLPNVFSGTRS